MAHYFKDYIYSNTHAKIGDAFNYAIQKYGQQNPERLDILLGYQLLGDPTLIVK